MARFWFSVSPQLFIYLSLATKHSQCGSFHFSYLISCLTSSVRCYKHEVWKWRHVAVDMLHTSPGTVSLLCKCRNTHWVMCVNGMSECRAVVCVCVWGHSKIRSVRFSAFWHFLCRVLEEGVVSSSESFRGYWFQVLVPSCFSLSKRLLFCAIKPQPYLFCLLF